MTIADLYKKEKDRFLDQCIQCGLCAEECPVLPYTDMDGVSSVDIQEAVYDSVETGSFNTLSYTKAFACMECFKCTADLCPRDLNPMLVNELIKRDFTSKGKADSLFSDAGLPDSTHRILSGVQVSEAEYERITTPTPVKEVKYLFYPGCNVYFQPDKILNALDIMDAIGDSYAFLPGLDYCCGDNHLFFGLQEEGSESADAFMAAVAGYTPEAVVLWCPTCQCRFDKYMSIAMDVPFKVMSFPQYLSKNMDRLALGNPGPGKRLTLHEPCKSAYTGIDPDGARQVLTQLPGVELREMARHGRETACCGSGAVCWFPDSFRSMGQDRLKEAEQTGAEMMATVCHFCGQAFGAQEDQFDFEVINYVTLVAEAMGIRREDKFKKYRQWNDIGKIMADIGPRAETLPFSRETIVSTLETVFIKK